MKLMKILLLWFISMAIPSLLLCDEGVVDSLSETRPSMMSSENPEIEGRVKTVYDINSGRPVNQSETAKGYHRSVSEIKLSGTGIDTITINSDISDGRQDVSFLNRLSYFGQVWSLNQDNGNTYRVIPISGSKFIILSSDSTDTGTVRVRVEGE